MKTIHVITGPTAVGKTKLAIEWALEHNAEIVSCDSLLFYRGMDIGTAKPSKEELALVPHHCINLVEAGTPYNISMYLQSSAEAVEAIFSRGKNVLVTGGSGFYLKGFFAPVFDGINIPKNVEDDVNDLFKARGLDGLVEELKRVSPTDFDLIDLKNSRRVIPALKRCLTSGMSVGALREKAANAPFPFQSYEKKSILLKRSTDLLKTRIGMRTKVMLDAGLVEEVEQLLKAGFESNPSACLSIGYREVVSYLRGELNSVELEEQINCNTYKLVKKQLKWFKHQIEFDQTIDLDSITPDVKQLFV